MLRKILSIVFMLPEGKAFSMLPGGKAYSRRLVRMSVHSFCPENNLKTFRHNFFKLDTVVEGIKADVVSKNHNSICSAFE
jgi:hypothetical protein